MNAINRFHSAAAICLGVLVLISLACGGTVLPASNKSPKIEVDGTVKYGTYFNPINPLYTAPYEYDVEVNVKNTGSSPFRIQYMEGNFINAEGKGLSTRMYPYPQNVPVETITAGNGEAALGEGIEIPPGEERTYEFTTDGYTQDLLMDSKGGKLFFQIIFYEDGKPAYGPFLTVLPTIDNLITEKDSTPLVFVEME